MVLTRGGSESNGSSKKRGRQCGSKSSKRVGKTKIDDPIVILESSVETDPSEEVPNAENEPEHGAEGVSKPETSVKDAKMKAPMLDDPLVPPIYMLMPPVYTLYPQWVYELAEHLSFVLNQNNNIMQHVMELKDQVHFVETCSATLEYNQHKILDCLRELKP